MDQRSWKLSPLQILFSFQGRINRLDFWLYSLIPVGIMTLGLFLLIPYIDEYGRYTQNPSPLTIIVFLMIMAVAIWISLAVQAKRWHDIDRSAWWMLLNLVPYAYLVLFFVLGFLKGTEGPNRFGPDPLEQTAGQAKHPEEIIVHAEPVLGSGPGALPGSRRSVTLLGQGHNAPPIVLEEGVEITVGRSRRATVVLNDQFVSSLHLALRLNERGEVTVRDLGSTNGTYLQGRRLAPNQTSVLRPGEKLAIGSENIVYVL